MTYRTSGLNKIILPLVNFTPTWRFLAIMGAIFPLKFSSKPKHTTSMLYNCEVVILISGALAVALLCTTVPCASDFVYSFRDAKLFLENPEQYVYWASFSPGSLQQMPYHE
jgi:hypothetical protein